MTTRAVIDKYYDTAKRGAWDEWLTLFADDVTGDEQLAGHFEGIEVLLVDSRKCDPRRLFPRPSGDAQQRPTRRHPG